MQRRTLNVVVMIAAAVLLMAAVSLFTIFPYAGSGYFYPGVMWSGMMGAYPYGYQAGSGWGSYGGMMGGGWGGMMGWGQAASSGSWLQLSQMQLGAFLANESLPKASNGTLMFTGSEVRLVVLMGPMGEGENMYSFVIDNMTNPTLVFKQGASVTALVVNVDTDAYHSLTLSSQGPPYYYNTMPMMMYSQATSMMLPPATGVYSGELVSFTADSDAYYICTVPGHAQEGMYGRIIVE